MSKTGKGKKKGGKAHKNKNSSSDSESSCSSSNSSRSGSNNNKNSNNTTQPMAAALCSTPMSGQVSNRFESLYEDAGDVSFNTSRRTLPPTPPGRAPLPGETSKSAIPALPDIPNIDMLSEAQKTRILVAMAEKLGISHPATPPIPPAHIKPTTFPPAGTTPSNPQPQPTTTNTPSSMNSVGGRSQSRKRRRVADTEAVDPKGPNQLGSDGVRIESVFLTGVKEDFTKNGIIFQREFGKAVPHINIAKANFTRSGCVILTPATPEDFSKLMKEDWSKHILLGNSISASLPKSKTVKYQAVVTGVDPELDDDTLKTELEGRNNLKLNNIARLLNKETRSKTYKVIIGLENEETQKRVVRSGVFLGFQHHKCVEAFDRRPGNSAAGINQCFRCQRWNPDHTSAQCKGQRACVWCGDDHFHRECPHFQNKNREKAKCANCKEAHPSWSHSCVAFEAASKTVPKASAAKIVGSASISRSECETSLQIAMSALWGHIARVVSVVVSRAVLDLEVELKKPKVNRGELVLKATANTVKAIKDCGLQQSNKPLEVTDVQQKVWKDIFPQAAFPGISQASSTPHSSDLSQAK